MYLCRIKNLIERILSFIEYCLIRSTFYQKEMSMAEPCLLVEFYCIEQGWIYGTSSFKGLGE
jgi:hypothetical protein